MSMKSKSKTIFICQNCGAQKPRWEGRCSDCGAWNSLTEEVKAPKSNHSLRGWKVEEPLGSKTLVQLDQSFLQTQLVRYSTGISELDRVLGGGLTQGSLVLVGGAPGIGKSTLLMQMAGGISSDSKSVIYITGEESTAQTGARAHRLGIKSKYVSLLSESNLDVILQMAQHHKPEVLIIDSIQTVYIPDLQSAPGTVSQIRECAAQLLQLSKTTGMSIILIGHVTKDGNIAGPKVLEHMVDTVLSFEGDMTQNFRLLRSLKNRFGGTSELGVFNMSTEGLKEVTNPSELFLEQRSENTQGSVVFAWVEGSRSLLCEVQALSLKSYMAMPRRTSVGFELQRLHMLTAVMEKHLDIGFSHEDLYINVVGGLEIREPAADLAVACALLSAEGNFSLRPQLTAFGEIGLTGEVRAVSFAEQRIKEAIKLGIIEFVLPKSNEKHLEKSLLTDKKYKFYFINQLRALPKILKN